MGIVEMRLLKNQLLGMFWLIFVHFLLITAEPSKDFLVTKFDQKRILRWNEDYVVAQTYQFFPETEIENFQAKCQKDKLMLIWVDKTEFVMRYIDSKSFMTPPDDLKFNSDKIFDVQANGDLLVMTTTNETHTTFSLGNFITAEVETVLFIKGSHLRNVAIHPTKRVIYYTTCFGATFVLNVYDVDAKQNIQSFAPPHCLDGILFDDKNDILWAFDGDQLFKGSLKKTTFEEVYQRDRGMISSLALGSKDLLILHYKKGSTQMYNFTLNPTPIKELTLPPFRITPITGYVTVLFSPKLFLLDVDNEQLILYDKDFKEIWKNPVKIENKDVASINAISRSDGSMEFYWIHPSNAGKMEVVFVSSAGTLTDRKTIQLGNEDITDFSINEKYFTFYLAINNGIYSSNPDISHAQPQVTTLFYDMKKPVKAVLSKIFSLVVTFCDGVTKRFSYLQISNPRPMPHETVECFNDVQVISNDPYFVSSTGIYAAAPRMQNFEKLYDIQGLKNILTYDGHVYFVASLADTGPGIYKLPKSRSGQAYYSPGDSPTNFVAKIKGDCRRMRELDDKWEVKSTADTSPQLTTKDVSVPDATDDKTTSFSSTTRQMTKINDKPEAHSTVTAEAPPLTTKRPSEPNDVDDKAISSATTASSDKTSDKRLSDNNSASKVVWNIYEIYVLATFLLLSFLTHI